MLRGFPRCTHVVSVVSPNDINEEIVRLKVCQLFQADPNRLKLNEALSLTKLEASFHFFKLDQG